MQRTEICDLFAHPKDFSDIQLTLAGWLRTLRHSKSIGFLELSDGSCFDTLQVVCNENTLPDFKKLMKLGSGSAIIVRGTLTLTPDARQPFELQATKIEIEGTSPSDYPLQKKHHSLEYLREIAHLRPRTNTLSAVFRIRSAAAFAIHHFFHDRGFYYIHTPIITSSDAEGAGEMFRLTTLDFSDPPHTKNGAVDFSRDFFGLPVSLTVSGQLEGECMAMAMGKTYTFGPTFRAEDSNTARHAAEFWMVEPEIAFADLNDDRQLAQDMMQSVLRAVMNECPKELDFLNQYIDKDLITRLTHVVNAEFSCIDYTEAVSLLEKNNDHFTYPVSWGIDLQTEHERFLTEEICKGPVFVVNYPKAIKAFYMRQNDDGKTVAAMDMLVPGIGEIIGGSQREEREDILRARMRELGMQSANYQWYLDLRRFGSAKHSGFGLGFERLIMYLTGIKNIRDVLPFPRTAGNARF
ncbi:MAG TPA: asparagine--tRNA ligase [Ruminococcaceae bacterium]|nr:asparagine--tRNA ligase [Oscillospiraceae bacterium]